MKVHFVLKNKSENFTTNRKHKIACMKIIKNVYIVKSWRLNYCVWKCSLTVLRRRTYRQFKKDSVCWIHFCSIVCLHHFCKQKCEHCESAGWGEISTPRWEIAISPQFQLHCEESIKLAEFNYNYYQTSYAALHCLVVVWFNSVQRFSDCEEECIHTAAPWC